MISTEVLIIISLTIVSIIFITLYVVLRINVKNLSNQLNNINTSKTNSKILIFSSDKQLVKLILAVNTSLMEKQKVEIEYKRMELELRQAIANMSHDLRTPLTSIMGYLQLIEDDRLTDEEKKQYIDTVKNRSKSLQMLISSFYDLSRLEAKEYKFEFKALNLTNILCDNIASFYNDFLNKGIEPVVIIDEKAAMVIADENAVRRIFSNLIQNMLKYGEKVVTIALEHHSDHIITVFKNATPFLSEEEVSHLFERFYTADRTRSGKSTGLGLSITKQLVEQMGHTTSAVLSDGELSIAIKWNRNTAL